MVKKLAIIPQLPTTDSVEEAMPSIPANKFEENHGVEHTNKSQVNTKDLNYSSGISTLLVIADLTTHG